tara:strand:+ start:6911 stop:7720 length:810 start_codon:yes stop_codon:yes gene_type:complete
MGELMTGIDAFSLNGKTALVTGASGHLGRQMAMGLAEAGANVLVNARSIDKSDLVVSEIRMAGYLAEHAVFDVTDQKDIECFVSGLAGRSVNIVINNAYSGSAGSIELSEGNDYAESYDVALIATQRLLVALLPNLRQAVIETGDASVINIASMYALVSPDQRIYPNQGAVNPPFYGAAKAALLHWTKYAACEFGKEAIRVNAISPGAFPAQVVHDEDPSFIESLEKKVPMGRTGNKEEIKGPLLFLSSSAASYVNGSNVVVDGGWTCW